nr:MAG TPA: hypothetical protein [Caudoviricetes sp.]
MKCHYEKIKGVGKVLIPGCWSVVISGDIRDCTCHNTTYESFERDRYNVEVKRLKGIITELEKENEYYRKLLERNEIKL